MASHFGTGHRQAQSSGFVPPGWGEGWGADESFALRGTEPLVPGTVQPGTLPAAPAPKGLFPLAGAGEHHSITCCPLACSKKRGLQPAQPQKRTQHTLRQPLAVPTSPGLLQGRRELNTLQPPLRCCSQAGLPLHPEGAAWRCSTHMAHRSSIPEQQDACTSSPQRS